MIRVCGLKFFGVFIKSEPTIYKFFDLGKGVVIGDSEGLKELLMVLGIESLVFEDFEGPVGDIEWIRILDQRFWLGLG